MIKKLIKSTKATLVVGSEVITEVGFSSDQGSANLPLSQICPTLCCT